MGAGRLEERRRTGPRHRDRKHETTKTNARLVRHTCRPKQERRVCNTKRGTRAYDSGQLGSRRATVRKNTR
eukprot:12043160-Prorocentrum_lima.AAC.1